MANLKLVSHGRNADYPSQYEFQVCGSEMEGPFNELLDRIKRKTSRIVADMFFSVVGCYFSSGIVDNGAVGDGGCGRRCGRRWWWRLEEMMNNEFWVFGQNSHGSIID
ncbi:hypothetical protein LguiB_024938 [Lonicera macranthoides]